MSADGRLICIPTVDKRAFESDELGKKEFQNLAANPSTTIDRRVQDEGLSSYLNIYDTETGRLDKRQRVERAWITHVQFSPLDSNLILYNHEWPVADCGIRRMWMWDGTHHHRMRQEGRAGAAPTGPVTRCGRATARPSSITAPMGRTAAPMWPG